MSEPTILHVDMDAFYASVEQLENPELRNRPLIVGGDGARGVVASCSYEARFYGVRSAMPSARAKRLCPHAVFVPGHFWLYQDYSRRMHQIFQTFTPCIESISLDEAFLDVGGAVRLFGAPEEIAHKIRNRIHDELGLWASVGAATSKHVAKLGSRAAKPKATKKGPAEAQGVVVFADEEAVPFLHSLPVKHMWGIGPSSAVKLERIGITTVRQLANTPVDTLRIALGSASAQRLYDLAWNRDGREVIPHSEAKSIGHEQTFPRDLYRRVEVHQNFARLCDAVASRLREAKLQARTVTAKIRFGTFETITRSRTLDQATSNAGVILKTIDSLITNTDVGAGIRLLGVSMTNLETHTTEGQLPFAINTDTEAAKLDEVIDQIRDKFGVEAVAPAQLIRSGEGAGKGVKVIRRGDRQWGPNREDK